MDIYHLPLHRELELYIYLVGQLIITDRENKTYWTVACACLHIAHMPQVHGL